MLQILRLKNGEVLKGEFVCYLEKQFVLRIPKCKGLYERRNIPFNDVEFVSYEQGGLINVATKR